MGSRAMAEGVGKVFLCLLFVTIARANERNVETPMSREEVQKLVEEMGPNYSPTRYEREMIMKYLMPTLPSDDASYADNTPEATTEWFELATEPENEQAEVFQPTHEVVLPIQEHPPAAQEPYDEEHPAYEGSSRGIAGFNYPNYLDIPETSFTCMEKDFIPGFYADLETGCQVFHVCWPHRRESFLCPVGTTFNQALLACDFWYNSNCSLAPLYYNVNAHAYHKVHEETESGAVVGSMIDTLIEKDHDIPHRPAQTPEGKVTVKAEPDVSYLKKFLPIKAKVTVYPETSDQTSKITDASVGKKIVKGPIVIMEKPAVQKYHYTPSVKLVHTPSVSEIVDEIFDVAKKIVEESRGLASRLTTEHMKLHKPKPLLILNSRFVTKPVVVENIHEEPAKGSKVLIQSRPESVKVEKILYKPAVRVTTLRKVSPLTRKVLAGNYLKLLKMKA